MDAQRGKVTVAKLAGGADAWGMDDQQIKISDTRPLGSRAGHFNLGLDESGYLSSC